MNSILAITTGVSLAVTIIMIYELRKAYQMIDKMLASREKEQNYFRDELTKADKEIKGLERELWAMANKELERDLQAIRSKE